ncbi:MAG: retropepsin-like domain-containing protein, partial [Sedimentisphaerales bacterium]|nr:retropepsin-like domain-containing protein [Sedimentisphaerales bacterium]
MFNLKRWLGVVLAWGMIGWDVPPVWAADDVIIYNSSEVTFDIPRIYFLLRRTPDGQILPGGSIGGAYHYAFFDTGASGIIMSYETYEELFGVVPEPGAQFADVGVAGKDIFGVSEQLYVSLAPYDVWNEPLESDFNQTFGPIRAMLTLTPSEYDPLDIFGVPLMAGKTVVITPSVISSEDYNYCSARVHDAGDPAIPKADIQIKLRMRKYYNATDPDNIEPLPTLAYNPVVDDVTVEYNGIASTKTWLLDTGASSSMISPEVAHQLGLTELDGTPIVPPLLWLEIGGVGGTIEAPLYQLDSMTIPTLNGYNLVYDHLYVLVVQIGTIDDETGEPVILDGVLGSNFYDTFIYGDELDSPFHEVVFDADQAILGLVVDTSRLTLPDHCGDIGHPYPEGDFNEDCIVDP